MTVLAELLTPATRGTVQDIGLIVGAMTALGAVGVRWLRREIRAEVDRLRDEVRQDLRPNGGSSGADAIARLVIEHLERRHNAP
jgi:hypothetical protein